MNQNTPDAPLIVGIVDDDEAVRDAMNSLLQSAGYKSVLFPSAEDFLNSSRIPETDCLLLDEGMPGLSGLELQMRLNEMKYFIPTIFVTAQSEDSVRTKALAQGAVAFLDKPFSATALLDAIRVALKSRNAQ